MSEIKLAYITANEKDTQKIVDALLKERLIACANIFPVKSKYWWKGKIEENEENIIIAKTRNFHVDDIIEKVNELSSYDCPCVLILDVNKGNEDFIDWIEDVTS